ncbi:MAG: hypothetical protein ACREPN_03620 [Rudaea sp.]
MTAIARARPGLGFALLAALFTWAAVGSNSTYDTYRDIFMAQSIVSGHYFPLNGPTIGNIFHLGPLWFYLLALPLWLIRNPVAVNATIGLLGALQFPLAYLIGKRFGGERLGVLFALALALPGWSAFPLVELTHVTVVPTCVLFGALAMLRYRDCPNAARALVLGLACACMLHAHPTTLLLAALCVVAAAKATPSRQRIAHAVLAIAPSVVLLSPMLVYQALNGWPDFATASTYAGSQLTLPSPARAAKLLLALFDYGADYVARFWFEARPPLLLGLLLLNATWFLAAAAGLALIVGGDLCRRRWVGLLVLVLVAQTLFVIALREITPFWMIYAHLPLIAALVALGLNRVCAIGSAWRVFVGALALVWTLWSLAAWRYLALSPWHGLEGRVEHYGLMDISEHETRNAPFIVARIPVWELGGLAADCAPVTLYAHYALFVDQSFGVGALAHCGSFAQIRLGGIPDAEHPAQLGLRDYVWAKLNMLPQYRIGSLGVTTPVAVWHSPQSLPVVDAIDYPPRHLAIASQRFTVNGNTGGADAIVISNRALDYGPFRVVAARVDGAVVAPLWTDPATVVLRAPQNLRERGSVAWSVDIDATPAFVDVAAIAGNSAH